MQKLSSEGGAGAMSKESFQEYLDKFHGFKVEKQWHVEQTFHSFDSDHSNVISAHELEQALSSMGINVDSDAGQSAKDLIQLVDANNDGELGMEEFKVLMCLAFEKEDGLQEVADYDAFFEMIDEDGRRWE